MAFEKRWGSVSPRIFIQDGGEYGEISIASTSNLKVKQKILIKASGEPNLEAEIKRVVSNSLIIVGERGKPLSHTLDVSAYTIAKNAQLQAEEQNRPAIPATEHERAVYEEEPTVAKRVVFVDEFGNLHNKNNPIPVDAIIDSSKENPDLPTIINATIVNKGDEIAIAFPEKTTKFTLRSRTLETKLQFSFSVGNSGINYITIPPGARWEEDSVFLNGKSIYIQASKNNTVIELLAWSFS